MILAKLTYMLQIGGGNGGGPEKKSGVDTCISLFYYKTGISPVAKLFQIYKIRLV